MSERGVFAVDRGIFDHPRLKGEKYTKVQAFMWLIAEAAWKPHRRLIGANYVDLHRGQAVCSLRFMAEKWGWEEPRVRRFLTGLKTDAMIDTATDAGVTVITICNYDTYQRVSLPADAPADAPNDAVATQQRRKVEDKEIKESLSAREPTKRTDPRLDQFEVFAKTYPRKHSAFPTTQARRRWVEAMKRGEDPAAIIAGAKAYAAEQDRAGNLGTRFVKGAEAWLHQQLWKDYVGQQPVAAPTLFGEPRAQSQGDLPDETWREFVRSWSRQNGRWPLSKQTPPPDDPNTKVPRHILSEFNIHPAHARAA